ncbi:cyclophilin-like protein [Russula earlei]|uniref:Cyclophilin-like protein n=1 Tax=Russula earlei TaxID=71964 RepID=A0ACC0U6S5_9AGAM|nr:cyclophilin-like protein [Russula earlei]
MALPTYGRVLLDTTAGDIDIELWSKEAPRACRNFIALAMEGYYDGVIFHRVVPDFLVQTGDRTGTGFGGESFFGEPFEDEVHPRLRFAHRGLVGMANNGAKNSNDSQFFITLDRADELHGKHTLFGRCVGDTIYNVMKIGAMELGDNGRPLYPPKIKNIRIIDNPFDDIVPRITAEEKRVQQRARQTAIREREEAARRKGAKKDTKLLSFGADADEEEGDVSVAAKKKSIARPDLIENPNQPSMPILDTLSLRSGTVGRGEAKRESDAAPLKSRSEDLSKIRETHQREKAASSSARQTEIEIMEAEVKRLARRRDGEDSEEERNTKKVKNKSQLEGELARYEKSRGIHRKGQRKDESDVLAALAGFRSKLQTSAVEKEDEAIDVTMGDAEAEVQTIEVEAGIEVDKDRGFMGHMLQFPKGNEEEVRKAEREYEVIDPRTRSAQARQDERERRAAAKRGKGSGRR